jgi:antirestriction protein ArdC
MADLPELEFRYVSARLAYNEAWSAASPDAEWLFKEMQEAYNEYNEAWGQVQDHRERRERATDDPAARFVEPIVSVTTFEGDVEGLGPLYFAQRFAEAGGVGPFTESDLRNIIEGDQYESVRFASPELLGSSLARVNALLPDTEMVHEMSVPVITGEFAAERVPGPTSATAVETKPARGRGERRDVAEEVTKKIMALLEQGTVPWHKPWTGGQLPTSMSSGKPYRGMNSLLLSELVSGYSNPNWGTYKQIEVLGGQVTKGEHGTMVTLYKPFDSKDKDKTKSAGDETEKRRGVFMTSFIVFNATQCTGLPEKMMTVAADQRTEHERIEAAEAAVAAYLADGGPTLEHGSTRAFFRPSADLVAMPDLELFESPEHYYSTMFHELTHSTGHKSRLAREGVVEGHRFGDELYSKEELIAELGAAMACASLGIEQAATVSQSAAYIQNWLGALRDDKSLILQAAAGAQKAIDHMGIGIERELSLDEEVTADAPEVEGSLMVESVPPSEIVEEVALLPDGPMTPLGALEAQVREYRRLVNDSASLAPKQRAANYVLVDLCQHRKELEALPEGHRKQGLLRGSLRSLNGYYDLLTREVPETDYAARNSIGNLVRNYNEKHANDALVLAELETQLSARREELYEQAMSRPHDWVAKLGDDPSSATIALVEEWRQQLGVQHSDLPFGDDDVSLSDERQVERGVLRDSLIPAHTGVPSLSR